MNFQVQKNPLHDFLVLNCPLICSMRALLQLTMANMTLNIIKLISFCDVNHIHWDNCANKKTNPNRTEHRGNLIHFFLVCFSFFYYFNLNFCCKNWTYIYELGKSELGNSFVKFASVMIFIMNRTWCLYILYFVLLVRLSLFLVHLDIGKISHYTKKNKQIKIRYFKIQLQFLGFTQYTDIRHTDTHTHPLQWKGTIFLIRP